ncbi:MAG: PLP-dependent aminotransferase family protein [Planctomycetota bacterium]
MWKPENVSPLGPVYLAIADALARDISSGRLESGERLPTHRALARDLNVNVVTITRAYQEAARRGLVDGEVGRGTFVREREERVLPGMPIDGEDASVVDFNFNVPKGDHDLLDVPGAFRELAADPGLAHLATGYSPRGFDEHRRAGAEWIARTGLEAAADRTLVTAGLQHAMATVFATVLEPGDTLLVEELTYPGVKALASLLHLKLAPLRMDDEGVLPDAFELACKKGVARAAYLQPTIHNPTAIVLPEERRVRIAELAERYSIPVIEDDTGGYLCPDAPLPIAARLPEHGYFLAGTSKSIAAGLRIGYVHAPASAVERITANIAATTWMAPPLMAELAARWVRDGSADAMAQWKRDEAAARREIFSRHLGHLAVKAHPGSSHVWMPLPAPWRGEDFVAQARRAGVAPTPADPFVVGRANAPHAVRLALGRPPERSEVERGVRALAEILSGAPTCPSIV